MKRRAITLHLYSLFRRRLPLIAFALSTSLFIRPGASTTQAVQQNLDAGFGEGGKVVLNTSKSFKFIRAIALQHKGKIVVAGDSSGKSGQHAFIGQLNEDGTLDTSFGLSGFADVNFDAATAIAMQPDKRILVAGRSGIDFGLARFNKRGTPDLSFGSGGLVTTDFFRGTDQAWALALQQDGKIILAGSARASSGEQFALARYNDNGSLDATFGVNGKVILDFSSDLSQALAVALQPDGKIVVAGLARSEATKNDFAIARLNQDGDLDPTFGAAGQVTTDFFGGFDYASDVIIQPDGRIVAVGQADWKFALVRYNIDGRLDSSFGNGGRVTTDFFGVAAAVAIQPDGKIIAAGQAGDDFALARYNLDGTPDLTFGTDGKLTIDFFENSDVGTCVTLQSDGKIIIAGTARHPNFKYSLALARLQKQ